MLNLCMPRSPFLIPVTALLRSPGSRLPEHVRGPIPELAVTGSRVPAGAEIDVDVVLESLQGGAIVVTGKVAAPWMGDCARCLQAATGTVDVTVREIFESNGDGEEVYPLSGAQVDLEPLARDAVLLELPLVPLCSEDCQGLCPSCGADLTEGGCECEREEIDPRWAALESLYPADPDRPKD